MSLHIVTPPVGESPTPDAYRVACDALADLRERLAALAAIEEYIAEGCGNAAHNIRNVLDGSYDPRPDADRYGLDYRTSRS